MEDYKQRVIEEAESLDDKVRKLNIFIETDTFKALEREDRDLLLLQLYSMQDYFRTLQKRLARFQREPVLSQDEVLDAARATGIGGKYKPGLYEEYISYHFSGKPTNKELLDFYAAIEKKILDKLGR